MKAGIFVQKNVINDSIQCTNNKQTSMKGGFFLGVFNKIQVLYVKKLLLFFVIYGIEIIC